MADQVGDTSSLLLGITWTWLVFSIVFVGARFYTRWKCGIKLWWDDFWVAIALVCNKVLYTVYTLVL